MTDIDQVKSKIDIVDFISEHIQVKKAGRNYKSLCPFHSEKTPSFVISPERQAWHCFGGCGEGGDVISFLQKWENIDFLEALKILANRTGVTISGKYAPSESQAYKDKLYEINHLSAEFYHYILVTHTLGKKALVYLKERGINKDIIQTFYLGYAPNSWDSLLKYLSKKAYSREEIYTAGLIIKTDRGNVYDRFRGRLMFTLKDQRGDFIGFAGRKLPPDIGKEAKYINTPETPVYVKGSVLYGLDVTKEAVKKQKEAIVVEGEFDCLASFQSGITNVVAVKGSSVTEDQAILLKRYTENVILALDSDFAGNEAAKRGIEVLEKYGLTVKVVTLSYGKDPAECIAKSPHLWKESLKTSLPILDFIIKQAIEKYNHQEVVGKKNIASEVIPFLSKLLNPIILSHYIKKLANMLEVTEESIEATIRQFHKKEVIIHQTDNKVVKVDRLQLLEEYFLALIIQSENVSMSFSQVSSIVSSDDFQQPSFNLLFTKLAQCLKNKETFDLQNFNSLLSEEITPLFNKIYMLDIASITADSKRLEKELLRTAYEIKKSSLRRKISILSTKIKEEEKLQIDTTQLNEQLRDILRLLRNIEISI